MLKIKTPFQAFLFCGPYQSFSFDSLVVRNNFLVVARKFSRPRLDISYCYTKYTCVFHTLKNLQQWRFFLFSGPYRIRTGDLLIANEALYQLS